MTPENSTQSVRHLVMFSFQAGTSAEQIHVFFEAFRRLKEQIPGILSFEHGMNNSPEGKNRGITHAVLITFVDASARDAYLPHPAHQNFGATECGILDEVQVVDYVPLA